MFHIVRAANGFYVVLIAKNGKVLSSSEVFTRKQNALNNIKAHAKALNISADFQDDTAFNPYVKTMYATGVVWEPISEETAPIYIPGKNKKSSKSTRNQLT